MSAAGVDEIIAYFAANWPIANPVSPLPVVAYPNRQIEIPSTGIWVDVNFVHGEGKQVGMAGNQGSELTPHRLMIGINVPKSSGRNASYQLADFIKKMFWLIRINSIGVTFKTPSIGTPYGGDDESHYRTVVSCPYIQYIFQ